MPSKITVCWLLAVLALSLLTDSPVLAVEKNKFKTCEQNHFCVRNRELRKERDFPYKVPGWEPKELNITDDHVAFEILDSVNNVWLVANVVMHEGGILRFSIKERNPLFERFRPDSYIIMDQTLGKTLKPSVYKDKTSFKIKYNEDKSEPAILVRYEPFEVDIVDESTSRNIVRLNEQHLFNFEHTRDRTSDAQADKAESGGLLARAKAFLSRKKKEEPIEPEKKSPKEEEVAEEVKPEGGEENEAPEPEPTPTPEPTPCKEWEEKFETHSDSKPHGPTSVSMDFSFLGSTHIYGIPEHATNLALKNTKGVEEPYRLYNLDVFEYEVNSNMALYGSIPFLLAHSEERSTGLYWNNVAETYVDISESHNGWSRTPQKEAHFFSEAGIIDLFVMFGPRPKDVFKQYIRITGPPALPPLFSVAYHQCRWNYKDQTDVANVDAGFDEHDIPYDVLWLDIEHTNGKRFMTWDSAKFPDPVTMQDKLAAKGRKMVTIVDPHLKRTSDYSVHTGAESQGFYIKDKENKDYDGWCWPGSSSWLDFLNPKAVQYWKDQLQLDTYGGSTRNLYIWNDMNEPSVFNGPEITMHKHAVHHGGMEHREVHNLYGALVHQATAEGLTQRSGGKERPFVLSRAFFAGSQRFGAIWTGDNTANWDHLKMTQPMLLSLGISGLPFVGADVGAFFGNPSTELLVRWYQAGAYHPFFRAHAHLDTARREPWLFGDETTALIRSTVLKRYSLLPLWYTLFYEAEQTGCPIMRPLWVEYPTESHTFDSENAFMVGSSLLVQPVVEEGKQEVVVSLPAGQVWYDYDTFESSQGGQDKLVKTPLSKIPVFIQGGSILPRKDRVRRATSLMSADPYTLVVAPGNDGNAVGRLYIDDGVTFDYKNGQYSYKEIEYTGTTLSSHNVESAPPTHAYSTAAEIERVVILGQSKAPSSVSIREESGIDRALEFIFNEAQHTLVIKAPRVNAASDWNIFVR